MLNATEDFNKKCKIVHNDELGRYVIAAVPIKAGETILLERPTLILPQLWDRRCTNCHQLTNQFCRKCQLLPLCADCPQHATDDCLQLLAYKNLNIALLQQHPEIYVALKCLLLRAHPTMKPIYDAMMALEAHMQERRNSVVWHNYQQKVVQPMKESGLMTQLDGVDEELLQRYYGIVDVNLYEIRAPEPGAAMRGLYITGSLFAHSCLANLVTAVDSECRLKVYANRYIAQGETLYSCYTNVLLGTDERRDILHVSKYFHCLCARCVDPTELGTHMSSFLCVTCAAQQLVGGYVVKQPETGIWQCLLCPTHTLRPGFVENMLERAKEEIFHSREDVYRQEILLSKLSRIFHPNHYLLLDLKQNIAAYLRQVLQSMAQRPSRKVYERKIQLCQDILLVLKDLQPGMSRLKAIALYELSNTQAELGRKLYAEGECTSEQLVGQFGQTEAMLREALRMLLFEPLGTPESQLARNMLKELKDLQIDVNKLQLTEN